MIRIAREQDAPVLAALAVKLWDAHATKELEQGFRDLLADGRAACFLQYADGKAVGFAQCQFRSDYVEGTKTSPVGYPEGIFVEAEYRGRGYGQALLGACGQWAREQHCAEFASDRELPNAASLRFHPAMGFREANRTICFQKGL